MDFPTTLLCIAGIAIGVAVICYVLLRTPKNPAKLPISDIVIGDEAEEKETPATEEETDN